MAGAVAMNFSRVAGSLDDQLDRVSGVMLAAGHDIDPGCYGREPHPLLGTVDAARDRFEIELVERALDRGLPLIGTCRGMQMLNVALGGTMVQDLSLVEAWRLHPSDPTGRLWRRFQPATMGADVRAHTLIIDGVLMIREAKSPTLVREMLLAYLPEKHRHSEEDEVEAEAVPA